MASFACACDGPVDDEDAGDTTDAGGCVVDVDCDDGLFCNGVEQCAPSDPSADRRGCVSSAGGPCAAGACDETTDRCDCSMPDADADGHEALGCGGDDCDDGDPSRHPGLTEVCDAALDEDCDTTTYGARDGDSDGFDDARCCNGATCGDDCNDANPTVHPTEAESCNAMDDDCDGNVDEDGITVWPDGDGDMFGDEGAASRVGCPGPTLADNNGDCDDGNASINPAVSDPCNGVDDNCNGVDEGASDFYPDCDADLRGSPVGVVSACVTPTPLPGCTGGWVTNSDDCDDTDASIYGGAMERCDRVDNDCSNGGGVATDEDVDGDGHVALGAVCTGGALPKDDCDDTNASTYPSSVETCDRLDNDCSSGGGVAVNEDADGDGHAAAGAACTGGPLPKDDCDDAVASTHTGATELCNRIDDNCSSGGAIEPAEDADDDGHAAPSASCTGGPLPKDDCDDTDPLTFPGAAPVTPLLLGPENGALTGSLHAAARGTLRPRFDWLPRGGCTATYDLEVDDSCSPGSFASCAFPSPELDATGLTATEHRPTTDLPVASTAPVGRRYYWRVRTCGGATCSAWSAPRYVDVGRTPADFNGDGWSDVVAGAPYHATALIEVGRAFVFYGSASGVPSATSTPLDNPVNEARAHFGSSVASAGDVNADGFADLVVGAPFQDAGASDEGNAFVYHGSASGIAAMPTTPLDSPTNQVNASFGASVASAGDVDGDGYGDIVIGAPSYDTSATDAGRAFVYRGSASGVAGAPRALDYSTTESGGSSGSSVASAGDVNGDGYADIVVGAPRLTVLAAPGQGRAFVYLGSAAGAPGMPSAPLDSPTAQPIGYFGASVASAGDVNGDGYADIVVGAPQFSAPASSEGNAFVFHGGPAGVPSAASRVLDNPTNESLGNFGVAVASAGDVDGDGYDDVVIGADLQNRIVGAAFLYRGSATGVGSAPNTTLDDPGMQGGSRFGTSVAGAGDVNGDGYADVLVGAPAQSVGVTPMGSVFVYHGGAAGIPVTPSRTLDNPANEADAQFGFSVAWCEPPPRRRLLALSSPV